MKEIKGLTGLRGYAALWVFFLHATWAWPKNSVLLQIASMGGSGVTIFFVLSGFILACVYTGRFGSGRETYLSFMRSRLARVYPLHVVALIAYALFSYAGYIELQGNDTPYTLFLNLSLLQAWGFTQLVSWNQPAWSISAELFSYLLFPIIIGFIARARLRLLLPLLAFLFYCVLHSPYARLIAYLQAHAWLNAGGKQFAHGLSLLQFFYIFCIGVVLHAIAIKIVPRVKTTLVFDVLMASGIALLLYWSCTEVGDLQLWQGSISASMIILALYRETTASRLLFSNPVIHYVGKISYALYLTALIVEICASHVIYPVPLALNLALALAVAAALHHFIEVPARTFFTRRHKLAIPVIQKQVMSYEEADKVTASMP